MASYAAVISLFHTLDRLRKCCRIPIHPTSREIIDFALTGVESLQNVLLKLNRSKNRSKRINALEGHIRVAVCELEDALESHVSNQLSSHFEVKIDIDLYNVKKDIDLFTETVNKLKEEYIKELLNPSPEAEDDDDIDPCSRVGSGGNKSKMVGFSDVFQQIKDEILTLSGSRVRFMSLIGMAGIGKTTLASEIFGDPSTSKHFDHGVWIPVGPKYEFYEVLKRIPGQARVRSDCRKRSMRYLVVLDDVWDKGLVDKLSSNYERLSGYHGILFLITTRLQQVGLHRRYMLKLPFLNKEESWELLREKVFGEEEYACPHQLQKAGKKIAENCEGLPLTIVTVADILSKADKTEEYWNKVAEKQNSVFINAYDQMSKVLLPSFTYLPQHLKVSFLYLGVFPQNCEIHVSKLCLLWTAEGMFEPNWYNPSSHALECLKDLDSR